MSKLAQMTHFIVGEWTVEPDIGQIRRNGESTELEPRVMDLLVYLADHAGETVSTDDLAETVWAGRAVTDQPVYQGIAQLRKAPDDEARHPRYIATVTKKGYRLIAAVGSAEADVVPVGSQAQSRPQRRILVPIVSLFLAGTYLFFSSSDVSVSREGGNPVPNAFGSIAVLPFVDMSEDRSQQYLGDGLAEELIHRIAIVPDLQVVARTSSFSFRDSEVNVQEIGKQLGAEVILEGSVRRSGDQLRITVQLVNASNGYHIWSQSYEPIASNAFAVQDQIASSVAQLLNAGAEDNVLPKRSWTQNTDAAEAYYLGMFHMHKRRASSLKKAVEYFGQALTHDPQFALAYAALSKTYFLASDARYGSIPDDEAMEKRRAATEMARLLDDLLPEVLEQLTGDAWDRDDLAEAETLILRAIDINPNYAPAYKVYGQLLGETGRLSEQLRSFQKAVALDPLSPVLRLNLAGSLRNLNRLADAEDELLTAIELDPGWHVPYVRLGRLVSGDQFGRAIQLGKKAYGIEGTEVRMAGNAAMLVAYCFLSLEDFATAERWYGKAEALNVDEWWLANEMIHLLIAQDRYDEADALLSHWENKEMKIDNVYRFGGLYRAVMGQHSAAIAMLEQAAAMSDSGDVSSLYTNSNLQWGYMPAVHLARLYMVTGSIDQGTELLEQAEQHVLQVEKESPGIPGAHYVRASIFAVRGNSQNALESLQQATDAGWIRPWFLERDPIFAAYHEEPEFQSILSRMRTHLVAERRELARLQEAAR